MEHLLKRSSIDGDAILTRGREVVRVEAEALGLLEAALDETFVDACKLIHATRRQLVVTGMGKSGHIARKIAATFAATGTPATFIHPAEAGHGDLGMLVSGDTLLVISNSGATAELRSILAYAHNCGIPIIGVAAREASPVIDLATVAVLLPSAREACAVNFAPTTSTALQLALGDALAMTVMDMRGISKKRLGVLHPAGSIGFALNPVRDIMHGTDRLPLVPPEAGMPDVISIMTNGRFGIAGVVDTDGMLVGVITDGDVRRHFDTIAVSCAADAMTGPPKSVPADMLVGEVLVQLNAAKITAAFIIEGNDRDRPSRPVGIIHIHDLLRFGLK